MGLSGIDIAVAAYLALKPRSTFEAIAEGLLISPSTAFKSVEHLRTAGLLRPDERETNRLAFLEFVQHGLRYVCPIAPGPKRLGVPTAHAAPPLVDWFDVGDDALVWASRDGHVRGHTVEPLVPRAAELAVRAPESYTLLALLDAVRGGRARERALGLGALRERLGVVALPTLAG